MQKEGKKKEVGMGGRKLSAEKTKDKKNKMHIHVDLGFFSGISSGERQIFDMMKSQLSFVDSVYS